MDYEKLEKANAIKHNIEHTEKYLESFVAGRENGEIHISSNDNSYNDANQYVGNISQIKNLNHVPGVNTLLNAFIYSVRSQAKREIERLKKELESL